MKRILLALSALAIGTAAASAADLAPRYTKAPPAPPPPPCIWCGFYIGLNGGWAGTTGSNNSALALTHVENSSTGASSADPIFIGPNTFDQNTSGGFGGGQIGYNWAFPGQSWLVGVEADIEGASLHRSFPTLFFSEVEPGGPNDVTSVSTDSRLDWFGTLRGRLGFLPTQSVLLYGTGGLAFGGVRNNLLVAFTDFNDCAVGVTATTCSAVGLNNNNNNTRWGWVAGAGIEWMFAPNWSIKGEYQYIDLGSVTQTSAAIITNHEAIIGGPDTETEGVIASRRVNERFNTVRIGVNYHFGGPAYGGY